jgi:hypothetical protein
MAETLALLCMPKDARVGFKIPVPRASELCNHAENRRNQMAARRASAWSPESAVLLSDGCAPNAISPIGILSTRAKPVHGMMNRHF